MSLLIICNVVAGELAVIIEGSIILCDIKQHSKADLCYIEMKIEKEELGIR